MRSRPHERAEVELVEARLLQELTANRLLVGLILVDPAARGGPDEPIAEVEADQQDAIVVVEHQCPRGNA
jgi:hypothetical protein